MKCRCTIFYACMGLAHIRQKLGRDTLHRTGVLHPVGYLCHIVHSGASRLRNIDTLFSFLGGTSRDWDTLC
jgi:hypothetical protein